MTTYSAGRESKWDGIAALAQSVTAIARDGMVNYYTKQMKFYNDANAIEAELRRRVEPLLGACEAVVAAHDPKYPNSVESRLQKELLTWRNK